MVWGIVVVAIAVLGVAAWAGTGRLGEMPELVSDRPKARIPEGPVDEAFLEALSLPRASTGYRCSQVDAYLSAHVAGNDEEPEAHFDVVRRGYDMQAVDAVLEGMHASPRRSRTGDSTETATESLEEEVPVELARDTPEPLEEIAPLESASDEAEPVNQPVPPDDDSAHPQQPAETSSRDLPAV